MSAFCGASPPASAPRGARQSPNCSGVMVYEAIRPVLEGGDMGVPTDGDFVQTICAVHHHGSRGAQVAQHAGHRLSELLPGDAQKLPLGPSRIGERAEDVKDGTHADLASGADGVLHGAVEQRREEKCDTHLRQTRLGPLGAELDRHP